MADSLTHPEQLAVVHAARAVCEKAQAKLDKARQDVKDAELEFAAALERLDAARHDLLNTI